MFARDRSVPPPKNTLYLLVQGPSRTNVETALLGKIDTFIASLLKGSSFVIPILMATSYFLENSLDARSYDVGRAFMGLVFFNTSHVVMTFLLLRFLPEFQSFRKERGRDFRNAMLVVGLISFPLLLFLRSADSEGFSTSVMIARPLIFVLTVHHAFFQTFGVFRQSSAWRSLNPIFRRWERSWVWSLIVVGVLGYYAMLFRNEAVLTVVAALSILIWGIGAGFAMKQTSVGTRLDASQYLGRYLCFAFCYFNPTMTLLAMLFHGVEYIQISRKMLQQSSATSAQREGFWICLSIWIPLCVVLNHASLSIPLIGLSPHLQRHVIEFFGIAATTLSFMHYQADRMIFRFSDPVVRSSIGRLFR